ncbi:putative disease resistance protein RGA4 [Bienertia sinuspersici]
MAEGIISDLVIKALEAMGTAAFRKAASWWGAQEELQELEKTMRLIQGRVHDAEMRQEADSGKAIKEWLRRLKLVLYQADDLFDEVLTRDRQKQRMQTRAMSGKVGILFSKSGALYFNRKLANEIKSIRKELDAIKSVMDGLNLRVIPAKELPRACFFQKRETASFVNTEDVVGRVNDKKKIIKMLYDPKFDSERVTVIQLWGLGVLKQFDLTKWAYVPEKDNLIALLRSCAPLSLVVAKRMRSLFLYEDNSNNLDVLVSRLQYLRVLSITSSSIEELPNSIGTLIHLRYLEIDCNTMKYLPGCITKLENLQTLNVMYCTELKELPSDLAKLTSLNHLLIPLTVFELPSGIGEMTSLQVLNSFVVGKNNGIDALSSLNLRGKLCITFNEWRKNATSEAQKANLKNSNQLTDLLLDFKDKDTPPSNEMNEMLMHLQLPPNLECLCIHNYSGAEMPSSWFDGLSKLVRVEFRYCPKLKILPTSLLGLTPLQSLFTCECPELKNRYQKPDGEEWRLIQHIPSYLRVLIVEEAGIKKLKNSIGRLIHLRYLDLNCCYELECLPDSITRLENLQTLKVYGCSNLRKLPNDFAKLGSLRYLLLPRFMNWTDLPSRFGDLTSLQVLNTFIVRKRNGIDSLPSLNLRGKLKVTYCEWRRNGTSEAQRANLQNNDQLTSLRLLFGVNPPFDEMNQMLMHLQLPPNLRRLKIRYYKGDEMPSRWLDRSSKLVFIYIDNCKTCKVLEYVEDEDNVRIGDEGGNLDCLITATSHP